MVIPIIIMNLRFTVHKKLLLILALTGDPDLEGWRDLKNNLWNKYPLGYKLAQGKLQDVFIQDDWDLGLNKAICSLYDLVTAGLSTKEFNQLFIDTTVYKTWLEKEWLKSKVNVAKELRDILRIELPKEQFTVFLVAPKICMGWYIGDKKILWGHTENWTNYSIVYLVHEYLHDLLGCNKLEHALIELIADNELRLRLNKSGDYFYINHKMIGHDFILELEKQIYNDWQDYLANQNVNIFEFVKVLNQKYPSC